MSEKTIHKWFFVWDYRKEERWLNEMALNGWVLNSVGFCRYTFRDCEPGEYEVRLAYPKDADSYRVFVESTGAEYVGKCTNWQYYRKQSLDGEFLLISDIDSRIAQLTRIQRTIYIVGALNLCAGMNPSSFSKVNLLCVALLTYAVGRLQGEKSMLEEEREIHE